MSTIHLRKSFVFQLRIKDFNDRVKKTIVFQRKIKGFNDIIEEHHRFLQEN